MNIERGSTCSELLAAAAGAKNLKHSQYLFKGVNICRNGSYILAEIRTELGGSTSSGLSNPSSFYNHIENLCNRFESALSSEIESIPTIASKKTYLTEVSNNLEEAFILIHQITTERIITVTHYFSPRILYTHDNVTVYVKYSNGKLYHILHPSEAEAFSKYIKHQFLFAQRALKHIQFLLNTIDKESIAYFSPINSDDSRIITNQDKNAVIEYFMKLDKINTTTSNPNHVGQRIMRKEDIIHLLHANFIGFDPPIEIKKFTPHCTKADLRYFVYQFYDKNRRQNKSRYAIFLIENFTQFSKYDTNNSKRIENLTKNIRNKQPAKYPF
jgi:hypothetical protein